MKEIPWLHGKSKQRPKPKGWVWRKSCGHLSKMWFQKIWKYKVPWKWVQGSTDVLMTEAIWNDFLRTRTTARDWLWFLCVRHCSATYIATQLIQTPALLGSYQLFHFTNQAWRDWVICPWLHSCKGWRRSGFWPWALNNNITEPLTCLSAFSLCVYPIY